MKKKSSLAGFEEILDALRSKGFKVSQAQAGTLVTKFGAGAVLKAGSGGAEFVVRPGAMVGGDVVLDNGTLVNVDEREVAARAKECAKRVWDRLG